MTDDWTQDYAYYEDLADGRLSDTELARLRSILWNRNTAKQKLAEAKAQARRNTAAIDHYENEIAELMEGAGA